MDSLVRASKLYRRMTEKIFIFFIILIQHFPSFASGDISALYSSVVTYLIYLSIAVFILFKMHGGKKLLGLFALAISMALDFFVSSKVPYVDYRIIILLFSVTNIIILFAVLSPI